MVIKSCNLQLKALGLEGFHLTQGVEEEIKSIIKQIHELMKQKQSEMVSKQNYQLDLKKLKGDYSVLEKQINRLKEEVE